MKRRIWAAVIAVAMASLLWVTFSHGATVEQVMQDFGEVKNLFMVHAEYSHEGHYRLWVDQVQRGDTHWYLGMLVVGSRTVERVYIQKEIHLRNSDGKIIRKELRYGGVNINCSMDGYVPYLNARALDIAVDGGLEVSSLPSDEAVGVWEEGIHIFRAKYNVVRE